MKIFEKEILAKGIRFSITENEREVARAYLYLMNNDLHQEPFGLLEDVFVDEKDRSAGLGKKIVQTVIDKAKELGCYKLIATSRYSRPQVHEMYLKLGFKDQGKEFRIDFTKE
ncbi:MAG TPA: GNAT family N-acetyltransferase [Oligoflexia bacterium]|nr:GNAT family N-acetyltransferase [Oligoflexia bacterium]HMP26905.1 GNAT family N-acetyltransferase [Oligoflexia bacterium]